MNDGMIFFMEQSLQQVLFTPNEILIEYLIKIINLIPFYLLIDISLINTETKL